MYDFKLNTQSDNIFIINLSEIEKRLDPNPYHKERLAELEKLEKLDCKKLKSVVIPSKSQTSLIEENDIYIGLENIKSDTGEYIKTGDKETISSANIFKSGQILFPKLRPYLNKVFLADFDGICSTEFHVFNAKNINVEYLSIYLRSSFVVNQTKHLMTGNTLPRLQTDDINNIPVPIISDELQQQIVDLYNTAFQKKQQKENQAKELLASIDVYLLDELGIQLPAKDNSLENRIFTTSLSQVSSMRLDPYYNDIFYLEIEKEITKCLYPYNFLKNLCYAVSGVIYSGNDQRSSGKKILRANNITLNTNELNFNDIRYVREDLELSDELLLKKQDILMSSASGSKEHVGKVAFISEDLDCYFGGFMNVLRKKQDNYNQKYLFEFLQSSIFRAYLYKNLGGTNINNLGFNMISNLKIPLPPLEKQTEISNHISAIRNQAKQLEQEATKIMEKAKTEVETIILGE